MVEAYVKQVRFKDGTNAAPEKTAQIQLNVIADKEGLAALQDILRHVGEYVLVDFKALQLNFEDTEATRV